MAPLPPPPWIRYCQMTIYTRTIVIWAFACGSWASLLSTSGRFVKAAECNYFGPDTTNPTFPDFSQASKTQIYIPLQKRLQYRKKLYEDNLNVLKYYFFPLLLNDDWPFFSSMWNYSSTKWCLKTIVFIIYMWIFKINFWSNFSWLLSDWAKFINAFLTFWWNRKVPKFPWQEKRLLE